MVNSNYYGMVRKCYCIKFLEDISALRDDDPNFGLNKSWYFEQANRFSFFCAIKHIKG